MNRRSFFGFLAAAPVAVAAMPATTAKGGVASQGKWYTTGGAAGESIMPLRRLPSGKLGGAVHGAGYAITPWHPHASVVDLWKRAGISVQDGLTITMGEPKPSGTATVVAVTQTTRKPA
ncbi:MAG: hypothetical protein FD152_779 [Xanthobacteraceae bacterium]|nr:MAG: hypothetical protein FD152_779 [Xanthobacteraceae bacterium]